jgi:hypothetical protein
MDSKTKSPLTGVNVRLANPADNKETYLEATDVHGAFQFSSIKSHTYLLSATYIGYESLTRTIVIDKPVVDVGELQITPTAILLDEVVVTGQMPPMVLKADTTEFNASAFKTNPDAVAEDLLVKMPGITVMNGSVKAQGEDVQQILVDGRPFFGTDPTLALRNLPADAIEKIQIFDKMSDQAEFTGFDDGQSVKTINIVTRLDRRNQGFGKLSVGYGDAGKYNTGGNFNLFSGDTRLSIIGISNNVNQQNFSMQDLLGAVSNTSQRGGFSGGGSSGRRSGGTGGGMGSVAGGNIGQGGGAGAMNNFMVGQQNGITSTNSLGTNYTDKWGDNIDVNGSYFFNFTRNQSDQQTNRQYFALNDSATQYGEVSDAETRNYNHRVDMRVVYSIDSSNSLVLQPRLYFQSHRASSLLSAANSLAVGQVLNQAENDNQSGTSGNNLSNHVVYRHRFGLLGRTVSVDFGMGSNSKNGDGALKSSAEYFQATSHLNDTLDQHSALHSEGSSFSSRLVYTEPVGSDGLAQLTYNPSISRSTSDSRKYSYDPQTGQYSVLETALSNVYENQYSTQNASVGFRYRIGDRDTARDSGRERFMDRIRNAIRAGGRDTARDLSRDGFMDRARDAMRDVARDGARFGGREAGMDGFRELNREGTMNFMVDLAYQVAALQGEQTFPFSHTVDRKFYNFLPSAMLNYAITDRSNLRLSYRTSTRPPSISQLQNVVDNSNPLLLTTGNPDLKQSFSHAFVSRYSLTSTDRAQSLLVYFSVGYTGDYIGNTTLMADRDTVLSRGIRLNRGTQLTFPVNLDGYWSIRQFLTYSLPFTLIQSNLNLISGFTYSRSPGLVNGNLNVSNNFMFSEGAVISSNVSENVDFTLSYTGNYTISRNTLQPESNNNYYYHNASLRLNLIFWDGFVFRNETNNTLYTGLTGGFNQNLWLWNISLGKKLFSDQRGEIRFILTDILNQNKSINRSITETYVQDTQTNVLGRYLMLAFTYTLR